MEVVAGPERGLHGTMERTVRVMAAGCAFLFAAEVMVAWQCLAEACDDGWAGRVHSGPGKLMLATAPFGLFWLVTPLLVALTHWTLTGNRPIAGHALVFPMILVVLGLGLLAVTMELCRGALYMDGWLAGDLVKWAVHGGVALFLAVRLVWWWRAPRVPADGPA